MTVTVAICTWNRAHLLDATLESFRHLQIPASLQWEILVVNNNSTDNTAAIIERHATHLPLVPLFEGRAGKSYAANLAASHTRGDLLVWTDDDVLVEPGWLIAYVRAAKEWPDAVYFAGPIDPWFEVPPPRWMQRHIGKLSGVFVVVDHGPAARRLGETETIFGANMAFRSDIARTFPLNEQLGRIQGALFGADDTEMIRRVAAAGMHGAWVPEARLRHFNPAARQTLAYVKRWYRDAGRSLVRQGGVPRDASARSRVPRWIVRQYVQEQARRYALALHGGDAWFAAFTQAMRLEGVMQELRAAGKTAASRV